MSLRNVVANMQLTIKFQRIIGKRYLASKSKNEILDSIEETPVFLEEELPGIKEKRNKSRLEPHHRNILYGQKPYIEPMAWYHNTLKYKRKILGRYGMEALGISAGVAWPTPQELEDAKEYERVAFPMTLQERWQKIKEENKKKEDAIMDRQKKIEAKMAEMNNLIALVREKVARKEAEAIAAKQKKEHRLEEIRKKLIAEGTATKEKIEEMLLKYEKEDKKKKKEAKKQKYLEKKHLEAVESVKKFKGKEAAGTSSKSTEGSPADEKSTE